MGSNILGQGPCSPGLPIAKFQELSVLVTFSTWPIGRTHAYLTAYYITSMLLHEPLFHSSLLLDNILLHEYAILHEYPISLHPHEFSLFLMKQI